MSPFSIDTFNKASIFQVRNTNKRQGSSVCESIFIWFWSKAVFLPNFQLSFSPSIFSLSKKKKKEISFENCLI